MEFHFTDPRPQPPLENREVSQMPQMEIMTSKIPKDVNQNMKGLPTQRDYQLNLQEQRTIPTSSFHDFRERASASPNAHKSFIFSSLEKYSRNI